MQWDPEIQSLQNYFTDLRIEVLHSICKRFYIILVVVDVIKYY